MSKKPTARAAKPQKAKTRTKPKGKAKSPSTKPTAEQLSDMDRQRLLMDHKRRIKPLLLAAKEAAADLREAYELAKSEGVPKKQIELAVLLETEEGRTKVLGQFQRMIDVDRWMGKSIGTQLELFDKQSPKEAAFEQGRIAALNNEARRAPSHLSDTNAQHWMEGWGSGMAQVNKSRDESLSGFKPLAAVASEAVDSIIEEREVA
jgi:hypothetical protein